MPVAILAGIPNTYVQRFRASLQRGESAYRAGWVVHYVAIGRTTPEIRETEIEKTLETASTQEAPHVIGISKQGGPVHREIAERIRPYFRFLWLDNHLLSHLPHQVPQFISAFNAVLGQEEVWASEVRPGNDASPLLLPACSFEAHPRCRTLWNLAEQYGEVGNIHAAGRALEVFRSEHWRPTPSNARGWVDAERRVFDHRGERHGVAPFPRGWKYSFRIPDGFHFDVTDLDGAEFVLRDVASGRHAIERGGYLNIDPHGHVRR